jgi:hypothetical protein
MKNINITFLQAELNRVSEWIKFADKKSAFLTAYYSVILGFLISQKEQIVEELVNYQKYATFFFVVMLICAAISFLVGLFFLLKSVLPRLKNSLTNKSLFYFGSIANMKFVDYSKEIENLTEDEMKKQIVEQIYTNSKIADQKMKNVKKSTIWLVVAIIFVTILNIF